MDASFWIEENTLMEPGLLQEEFLGVNDDELLNDALNLLAQDDSSNIHGGVSDDHDLLSSIVEDLDDSSFNKNLETNQFSFANDFKRALSPIKTINYNDFAFGQDAYVEQKDEFDDYGSFGFDDSRFQPKLMVNPMKKDSVPIKPTFVAPSRSASSSSSKTSSSSTGPKKKGPKKAGSSSSSTPKNSGNNNPWPSAKEYIEIFRRFLEDPSKFEKYTNEELGLCKLSGTPMQPEFLYKNPEPKMYFLECQNLRGKGSFGFPKSETLGKKLYEWKKTSYVNNVPKAKPIISYITANGNGKGEAANSPAYRMRIIKPINLDMPNAEFAYKWVLVDIHKSDGLARRQGPRPTTKCPTPTSASTPVNNNNNGGFSAHFNAAPPPPPMASTTAPTTFSMPPVVAQSSSSLHMANVPKHSPINASYKIVEQKKEPIPSSSAFVHVNTNGGERKNLAIDTGIKKPLASLSRPPTIPLSPMKRLSIVTEPDVSAQNSSHVTGSPKGKKMQRTSHESANHIN